MEQMKRIILGIALFGLCQAFPARERRQVVNAGIDAAKSAGHVAAAAGDALTLQPGKAAHELGRAVNRAGDSAADLGHTFYKQHPHGRTEAEQNANAARVSRQVVNAGIDAAKSAGHVVAAAGDALTLQPGKAAHELGRAVERAGDSAADLGHTVYKQHPHGRHETGTDQGTVATSARLRRQVVNAGIDAAKSAGHVAAAAGDALTLQPGKAAHELGRAVERAGDSAADLGHTVYKQHPHGRTEAAANINEPASGPLTAADRVRRQIVNAGIDAAKSAGHVVAAAGDALTLQPGKAGHELGRAVERAGDSAADLGHTVYKQHPHGRTEGAVATA